MLLLLSAALAQAADTDLDTIDDNRDRCAWEDDRVDLDANRVPDCHETVLAEFGMANATSTAQYWWDYAGVGASWSAWDANGYAYSGTAYFAPVQNGSLYYAGCIPITAGARHTVMGQFGTDTYDSTHQLVVMEFSDATCSRKSTSRVVASGYRASGASSLTLVGTYIPSGFAIRSIMVYATYDTHGVLGTAWFDHISVHP